MDLKSQNKEYHNNWAINVVFSDNGFGAGATLYNTLLQNFLHLREFSSPAQKMNANLK